MNTANPTAKRTIPSLDGLRALSIALVILAHTFFRFDTPQSVARVFNTGLLGVQVFFVISGYLITTLLLKEMDRSGRVHLTRFYFRRVLRIFPAYYAYLLVIAALGAAGLLAVAKVRWLPAVTYTTDIVMNEGWLVGHTWSLSVEEQFYLCWPACLILLGRRGALKAAAAVLLLSPVIRVATLLVTHDGGWASIPEFDSIAAGCLLAMLWPRLQHDVRFQALLRSRAFVLVPLSAWIAGSLFQHSMRWYFIADIAFARTYVAITLALTVAWCMLNATGRVGRVLNAAPVRALGVLSYSLYLWQQVFTSRQFAIPVWLAPIAALATAVVSYYLVERPGLVLREKLESRFGLFAEPSARERLTVPRGAAA